MSLIYEVEKFLRRSGMPASRFGREAVRDPRLVHDLRRGREPGAGLCRRVKTFIAEQS